MTGHASTNPSSGQPSQVWTDLKSATEGFAPSTAIASSWRSSLRSPRHRPFCITAPRRTTYRAFFSRAFSACAAGSHTYQVITSGWYDFSTTNQPGQSLPLIQRRRWKPVSCSEGPIITYGLRMRCQPVYFGLNRRVGGQPFGGHPVLSQIDRAESRRIAHICAIRRRWRGAGSTCDTE